MTIIFTQLTRQLAKSQEWRCIWCEFVMARDDVDARHIVRRETPSGVSLPMSMRIAKYMIRASFEHHVPRSLGGSNDKSNGHAACRFCNEYRGTEDALIFKARVVGMLAAHTHPRQIFREAGSWRSVFPDKPEIVLALGAAA